MMPVGNAQLAKLNVPEAKGWVLLTATDKLEMELWTHEAEGTVLLKIRMLRPDAMWQCMWHITDCDFSDEQRVYSNGATLNTCCYQVRAAYAIWQGTGQPACRGAAYAVGAGASSRTTAS